MCAVEWKKLGEIAEYRRGSFPQPYGNKEWYDGEGAMPFVQVADVEESGMKLKESTKQFISTLAMPMSVFVPLGSVVVTLQGSIGKVAITQYDSYVDRTLGIFTNYSKNIDKKYFAHQLLEIFSVKKKTARGGTIKTITKEEFSQFEIPIPSLAKQQEIVSHLDTFTTLISNLESELDMRRKQYEHYRNQLLDFEGVEDVEWKALKNIANFRNGKGHEKSIDSEGSYIIVNSKFISTNGLVKKYCNVQISPLYKDDILMVMSDLPNGKALARCYLVDIDNKYTLNQRICALNVKDESIVRTKYLYIILNRNKQLLEYDNGVDQTNLRKDDILNIHIPIPSLAAQQEIVEKLDAFENLIQSLEQEIKLRKQQYEYYREKLLTFEKE